MGRPSREKGARGEREVCAAFTGAGIPVVRAGGGVVQTKGDVVGVPGFHIQVKRQETFNLPAWLRQAHDEAEPGEAPAVVFRRSAAARVNDPAGQWHVAVPLGTFLYLVKGALDDHRH